MSVIAEHTLIRLLSDNDSLTFLAKEGIEVEVLPTEELRDMVEWALAYRTEGGKAPTPHVLIDRFTDVLNDNEIDLDDEEEIDGTIEWAMTKLHSLFAQRQAHTFSRELATAIAEADDEDRVDILAEKAAELAAIVQTVSPRRSRVDIRSGGKDLWEGYQSVVASGGAPHGMLFGLPEVDDYTRGIHDGELAMILAGQKSGKSFALDFVAAKSWERGRIAALFTLENSIELTMQRIGCMVLHISLTQLMHGTLDAEDTEKLRWWVHDVLPQSQVPLHIFNPSASMRTPQAIVQQARAVGADDLYIDQLTFMEAVKGRSRERQDESVGRMLHDTKTLISTGRNQMPCLMAHQLNRDGIEIAEKTGRVSANKGANSSETERTVDWQFGMFASAEQRAIHLMELQTLATRRAADMRNFELQWLIDTGNISVHREIIQ